MPPKIWDTLPVILSCVADCPFVGTVSCEVGHEIGTSGVDLSRRCSGRWFPWCNIATICYVGSAEITLLGAAQLIPAERVITPDFE